MAVGGGGVGMELERMGGVMLMDGLASGWPSWVGEALVVGGASCGRWRKAV